MSQASPKQPVSFHKSPVWCGRLVSAHFIDQGNKTQHSKKDEQPLQGQTAKKSSNWIGASLCLCSSDLVMAWEKPDRDSWQPFPSDRAGC